MNSLFPKKCFLILCLLLLVFTAGCGSKEPLSLPTKKPSSAGPADSSAPASSEGETLPAPSESQTLVPDPVEHFEQNMRDFFAEAPEQASAGNTAGSALDDGILKRTEWKIVSREGNTLEIAVTAPDMQALLQDQAMTILSQPDGVSQILSLLEKNNLPMREVTVSVTLDEDGNPTDPAALTDALYGGLLSVLEAVYASMEAEK